MNIIHLSDLHLQKGDRNRAGVFKNIVQHLFNNQNRWVPQETVVFITGDIAVDGELSSFSKAWTELKKLINVGFKVVCIPGNHDVELSTAMAPPLHQTYELFNSLSA